MIRLNNIKISGETVVYQAIFGMYHIRVSEDKRFSIKIKISGMPYITVCKGRVSGDDRWDYAISQHNLALPTNIEEMMDWAWQVCQTELWNDNTSTKERLVSNEEWNSYIKEVVKSKLENIQVKINELMPFLSA